MRTHARAHTHAFTFVNNNNIVKCRLIFNPQLKRVDEVAHMNSSSLVVLILV